ncbi:MAG: hypothetical protein H0U16_06750 [Actinobacteria bacterium]|nr:hypothetical protein [Actinomycetota bacterium]
MVVFSLIGAGVIHAVFFRVHYLEWGPAGAFFLGLTLFQVWLGMGFTFFSSFPRWAPSVAMGVSLLAVAVWAVSRTTGLPFGPDAWQRQPFGRADSITVFFELTTLAVLAPTYVRSRGRLVPEPFRRSSYPLVGVMGAATVLLVLLASVGSNPSHHIGAPGTTPPSASGRSADEHESHGGGSGGDGSGSRASAAAVLGAVPTNTFTKDAISFEARKPQSIHFVNDDVEPHNVSILGERNAAAPLFSGDVVPAGSDAHYALNRPLSAGRYSFVCDLHQSMKGIIKVR